MSIIVLILWILGLSPPSAAAPFAYHDHAAFLAELEALAAAHPGLAELFLAQDSFALPAVPDGAVDLEHPILRLTDEALGLDKPEVLLVAAQHGDEVVGLEASLALARLLLEGHDVDPWLTALLDRREVYLLPLANPHGFRHGVRWSPGEEGSEDMNRDHIYDRDDCTFGCQDAQSLSTVGARVIHELARRHLFRVVVDFHGGVELVLHPWGSPLHVGDSESPDDAALGRLGARLSEYAGPFSGFYPVGTANELLGAVHGPLDDTAYAASWDPANADPLWTTDGWRALSYTVELSNTKRPAASALGGDADLLTPGGAEDGYVPKGVRAGLAAIDIAEPYVLWTQEPPAEVAAGAPFTVRWQVRGCFEVDDTHARWGDSTDLATTFSDQSTPQSQTTGSPCFGNATVFSAEVTLDAPGEIYLAPVARVDGSLLAQDSPLPPLQPQSLLVRSRTDDLFFVQNEVDPLEINTVLGRLWWSAEPRRIVVTDTLFADGFESGTTAAWSQVMGGGR